VAADVYNSFVATYLLLGDDEERKARGVEKLRRGHNVESYDASETSPPATLTPSSGRGLSSSSGTSTPGTPPRRP
jgi:hypothetical protein